MSGFVTMSGYRWETGKDLVDAEVTLGSGDKSSSCKVTLSDPMHLIAAALINHSVASGGIIPLVSDGGKVATPEPKPVSAVTAPSTPQTNTATNVTSLTPATVKNGVSVDLSWAGTVSYGGVFSPQVRAFLDLIAWKEVLPGDGLRIEGYYNNNGVSGSMGYFTDQDIKDGGGFPATAQRRYNIGRYQFQRADWDAARKFGFPVDGYTPDQQDLIAIYKMRYQQRGWKELHAGDIRGAIRAAGLNWASLPGSPYGQVQAGYTVEMAVDYYEKRLAVYTGKTLPTKAVSNPTPPPKLPSPSATDTATPVIKGSPIVINIDGYEFAFVHQGTELDENGRTTLTGQGIRWQMSRRSKSRTFKGISLKQLAQNVANAHGFTLEYTATFDPHYTHLDQSGISDYQLLYREVDSNGLLISEKAGKLVITDRKQLKQPSLVLARGSNLIAYKISDTAASGKSPDISATLPEANRSFIDPVTGKAVTATGYNRQKDNATTGKPLPTVSGTTTAQGQQPGLKRIGGLPSTFTIPLSSESLGLTPVSTVVTDGLLGVLDRIWLVRKVTHRLAENTTTIEVVSPIETKETDTEPTSPPPTVVKPTATIPSQGLIYPCTGTVTSLWNPARRHPTTGVVKAHRGTDIGNSLNTPIYAVADGVVKANAYDSRGGGNFLWIEHENGYTSAYLHLAAPASARIGQRVKQGEQVGLMGATGGISTGVHLHLEYWKDRNYRTNPAEHFPKLSRVGNSITAKEKV